MNSIHSHHMLDLARLSRIDINLYPLFVTIFEHKNISQSAQILCISQSAASHALQRLRSQLKDDLFVRVGIQMLPTPFAEQIYPSIKNALFSIQNISFRSQDFDPKLIQSIKIAMHDEIEPVIFPKLVAHFQSLHLDIELISIKLDRKTIVADLASQQIDFVIDLNRKFDEKIQFLSLLEDHFMVCTQLPNMDEKLYLSSKHIGVSSRRTGILFEDTYLKRKQFSRQIFLRCQHYSTAIQILAQQPNAILTVPQSILSHLKMPAHIYIFKAPILLPQMNMGIFWHQDLNENSRHKFLKSEITKIFA